MATWAEASLHSFRAASDLLRAGRYRSCVSRAYYAVYAAVTSSLAEAGVQFTHDGNNPNHQQLPRLALNNLKVPAYQRRRIAATIRKLRAARVEADYVPFASITEESVRSLMREAAAVLRILEVLNESGG